MTKTSHGTIARYGTLLHGAPYGDGGERGPDVETLREAGIAARRLLCVGQRMDVFRQAVQRTTPQPTVARFECDLDRGRETIYRLSI